MTTGTGLLMRSNTDEIIGMTIRVAIDIEKGIALVFEDSSFAVIEGDGDEDDPSASIRTHAIDIRKVLSTRNLLDAGLINAAQAELIDKQKQESRIADLKSRAERAQKYYEQEVAAAKSRLDSQLANIKRFE